MKNHNLPTRHIYSKVCRMGSSRYTTIPAVFARDDNLPLHADIEWQRIEDGFFLRVIPPGTSQEAA
jgi:hypothetical protein